MSPSRWPSWPVCRWNPTWPLSPSWPRRCRFTAAAKGLDREPHARRSGRIAAVILITGFAVMLALNAPGQLSYDSVTQLAEGRAGHYNSWHPPLMAFLLGLFDRLVPGTLLFLLFQSLLLLGGLLGLLALKPRGWLSAVVALLIVLSPQWLL